MAYLMPWGCKKQDLRVLARELGVEIGDDFIIARIVDAIVKSPSHNEEFKKLLLLNIIDERKEQEEQEKMERKLELEKLGLEDEFEAYVKARYEDFRTRVAFNGFGNRRPIADQCKGKGGVYPDQKVLSTKREKEYEQRSPLEETPICQPLAELELECNLGHIATKAAVIRDSLDQEESTQRRKLEEQSPVEDVFASEPVILSDEIVLPVIEPEDSRADLVGLSREEFLTEQRKSEELKPLFEETKTESNVKTKDMTDDGMLVYKRENKDGSERKLIVVPEKFGNQPKSHEGTADNPGVTTAKDAKEKDHEIPSLQFSEEEDDFSGLLRHIDGKESTESKELHLRELLTKYPRTLSNVPGCTGLVAHNIDREPGKGFKPDNCESDAESGRSAELIQNGRSGGIPPDALYSAPNKKDSRPLYENVKPPDKNANRNEGALVYASLDLPNGGEARPPTRHPPPRRDDRTEYAEIQFQPPQVYEQASL